MQLLTMEQIDVAGKRVLIREDLNVPIKEGQVKSDARIRAALPTLKLALAAGAKVMVMSHLGRPIEGVSAREQREYSLGPVAEYLQPLVGCPVRFEQDWLSGVEARAGELLVLENVRFNKGEKANDEVLAKQMAALCDLFVMDAFGTAHRAQASTHGVAKFAPLACAGPLLAGELNALERALSDPQRPLVAIVGGSKVSTKLRVLESLCEKVDQLIVGGGIANTFLAAAGKAVGTSLCEEDLIPVAKKLMAQTTIPIPSDVVVASQFDEQAPATIKASNEVAADEMILDIGPQAADELAQILAAAKTIIWNGPVGVFEFDQFGEGTETIAKAIANSSAFSIAGGGDTLAAVDKYGIADDLSYVSTGGGAFLEYVEGKTLPAVAILAERAEELGSDT